MLERKRFIARIHIWELVNILKIMVIFLHMHTRQMKYLVKVKFLKATFAIK